MHRAFKRERFFGEDAEWLPTQFKFKSLPRVAEFIYIEGDNKRVCLLLELYILFITRLYINSCESIVID